MIILIILLSLVAVPAAFYAELLAWKNKKLEEEIEYIVKCLKEEKAVEVQACT